MTREEWLEEQNERTLRDLIAREMNRLVQLEQEVNDSVARLHKYHALLNKRLGGDNEYSGF